MALTFTRAGTVFDDPLSTTFPDPDHSLDEQRFLTIGSSLSGRILVVAHTDRARPSDSSARGRPPRASEDSMKKASKPNEDDALRPEYDFSSLAGGVRGKYFKRYRAGVNLALLEPEVANAFPTDAAVNEALRTVLRATKAHRRPKRLPNNQMQRTRSAKARRRGPRR
jgi:hypothetical protein